MSNKTVIINYDNKKRFKILLLGILLISFCLGFLFFMVFIRQVISVPYFVVFLVLAAFMSYSVVMGIKNMTSKNNEGLILNSEGIYFKWSFISKKELTRIKWEEIESISSAKIHGLWYVQLKLYNPNVYLKDNMMNQLRDNIINQGLSIGSDELAISFNDLYALIEKYFKQNK